MSMWCSNCKHDYVNGGDEEQCENCSVWNDDWDSDSDEFPFNYEEKENDRKLTQRMTDESLLKEILNRLPREPENAIRGFWYDGEEILSNREDKAEAVADFLEVITNGYQFATGYYDQDEDERNNEINNHTGWYYTQIV